MKAAVLGLGSWGISLAKLLRDNNHDVSIWGRNKEKTDTVSKTRESGYMPDFHIDDAIEITNDAEKCVTGSDIIVVSIASKAVRDVMKLIKPFVLQRAVVVNAAKGIEEDSLMLMSQVIGDELEGIKKAVLSGPSHAEEVCRRLPTTCVASADDTEVAHFVQDAFMSGTFRVYTSPDMRGVELGGALKNVISLAAGISDGLGYGDNTKAALMTRGIVEIARLGVAMGADNHTFSGLSGIGDLIVTCVSNHSRNRRAGIMLGQGKTLSETLASINMVVEGVNTTKAAYKLSIKHNVEMPITAQIHRVLFEGKKPKDAVYELMTRDKTNEQPHFAN